MGASGVLERGGTLQELAQRRNRLQEMRQRVAREERRHGQRRRREQRWLQDRELLERTMQRWLPEYWLPELQLPDSGEEDAEKEKQETESPTDQHTCTEQGQQERKQEQETLLQDRLRKIRGTPSSVALLQILHRRQHRKKLQEQQLEEEEGTAVAGQGNGQASPLESPQWSRDLRRMEARRKLRDRRRAGAVTLNEDWDSEEPSIIQEAQVNGVMFAATTAGKGALD